MNKTIYYLLLACILAGAAADLAADRVLILGLMNGVRAGVGEGSM